VALHLASECGRTQFFVCFAARSGDLTLDQNRRLVLQRRHFVKENAILRLQHGVALLQRVHQTIALPTLRDGNYDSDHYKRCHQHHDSSDGSPWQFNSADYPSKLHMRT
jgi:hypothetical protein